MLEKFREKNMNGVSVWTSAGETPAEITENKNSRISRGFSEWMHKNLLDTFLPKSSMKYLLRLRIKYKIDISKKKPVRITGRIPGRFSEDITVRIYVRIFLENWRSPFTKIRRNPWRYQLIIFWTNAQMNFLNNPWRSFRKSS